MLTSKIKELIDQLDEECKKERVVISMTAFDGEGEIFTLQTNQKLGVGIAIQQQIEMWEEMAECDCENCQKRKAQPAHEFHVDNVEDLVDVLDRIANGEFD